MSQIANSVVRAIGGRDILFMILDIICAGDEEEESITRVAFTYGVSNATVSRNSVTVSLC